jgi:hypothetical protein
VAGEDGMNEVVKELWAADKRSVSWELEMHRLLNYQG